MVIQPSDIYVCNVMGDMLYPLEDIDKSTVSLHKQLNGQWELSFTYTKPKGEYSPAYEALEEGMYLYVTDTAHFKMRQPSITMTASTESKEIMAYSCDTEFEDKIIKFPVNMGTETSLEYLVTLDDDEEELLVDPYTKVPYDWIVLYNTYPQQLAELAAKLAVEWTDRTTAYTVTMPTDATAATYDEMKAKFDYYCDIVTRITRLRTKPQNLTDALEYGDSIADRITVYNVSDNPEDEEPKYELIQYVTLTKNADGDTTAVTFETNFPERLAAVQTFYGKYHTQLSLLDILCDEMGGAWQPGDVYGVSDGDYTVANYRYQFEIDEGAYSFLTTTYAQRSKCVVSFDRLRRRINVTPVEHIGDDTGIELSYDQLLNSLNISTNEDTLATRIHVKGAEGMTGEDLTIEQINFGDDYIVDIDYKLNARDSHGRRLYVSDELAEKYTRYQTYRDTVARPRYIELTKQYNELNSEISELTYRVPSDYMQNDWDSFNQEDLDNQLKAYLNMLYALQDLYAEDYGYYATPRTPGEKPPWVSISGEPSYLSTLPNWFTVTSESDMIPRIEVIQTSIYWWDFVAYRQAITQIMVAIEAKYMTEIGGQYSNIDKQKNESERLKALYDRINAWKTQWDLYGVEELKVRIASLTEQLQALIDGKGIICEYESWDSLSTRYTEASDGTVTNPKEAGWYELSGDTYVATTDTARVSDKQYYMTLQACFREPQSGMSWESQYEEAIRVLQKHRTWEQLLEDDRKYFHNWQSGPTCYVALVDAQLTSYVALTWDSLTASQKSQFGNSEINYFYDEYVEVYNNRDNAQAYLDELTSQADEMRESLAAIQLERTELATSMQLPNYIHDGDSFSPFEISVIYQLYRDADYTNEYIFTTSISTTTTALDQMQELYDDAKEQGHIFSRPQLIFSVDADNMLALPEFCAWHDQFQLGNYMYIEYRDGSFIRVRLVGYTYNPCLNSDPELSLEFSNLTYSKTKVTDVESVLGMATATGTASGGGSTGGGGGGGYGALSEAGINLADTMLAKLLTKETFNKEVTGSVVDTLQRQVGLAKVALFKGLREGDTDVSGDCITTGTISSEAECMALVWHQWKDLHPAIQALFGVQNAGDYRHAINVVKAFAEIYSDTWADMNVTERAEATQEFFENLPIGKQRLFSGPSSSSSAADVFAGMVAYMRPANTPTAQSLCYFDTRPVSVLELNQGAFSYCGGNLKYGYDAESTEYISSIRDGYYDQTDGRFYSEPYNHNSSTLLSLIRDTVYHDIPTGDLYKVNNGTFVRIPGTYDQYADGYYEGVLYLHGAIDAIRGTIAGVEFESTGSPASNGYIAVDQDSIKMTTNNQSAWYGMYDDQVFLTLQAYDFTSSHHNAYLSPAELNIVDYTTAQAYTYNHLSNPFPPQTVVASIVLKNGNITASGNVNAVNLAASGAVSGNTVSGGTVSSTGSVSAGTNISASGNITTNNGTVQGSTVRATSNMLAGTDNGTSWRTSNFLGESGEYQKIDHNTLRIYGLDTTGLQSIGTYKERYQPSIELLGHNGRINANEVYAGSTKLTGGDYSEYFEWFDGNIELEDRRGRFVTMDGDKIKLASANDDYLLGIVTSTPSVTGNSAWREWRGKYMRDVFGAIITEPVAHPAIVDENGDIVEEAHIVYEPVINPEYDSTREYIPREQRTEWAPVGMVGQIVMLDDGTCEVNGFATSADEGIATKADGITGYRVIKRIDSNHIMVAAK